MAEAPRPPDGAWGPWPRGCPLCVLLNPDAGRSSPSARLRRALAALPDAALRSTRSAEDAARRARAAEEAGCRRLVVVGGDGTLHHVAAALRDPRTGPALGVVPVGTGNDFARALGLPRDPAAAVGIAAEGPVRRVDLIGLRLAGRRGRAVNFVLGGVGGNAARRVTAERKRRWGRLVYLRALAGELGDVRARDLVVEADGAAISSGPHLAVLVANGPTLGNGIPAVPPAELDDGLLDVVAVRGTSAAQVLATLARLAAGRHLGAAGVTWRRAERVTVAGDASTPFNADGEPLGAGTGTFEVLPGSLPVVSPPAGG